MITLDPALALTARVALAAVLAQAAWHKARDLRSFSAAVAAYELVPASLAPLAATQLLVAEIVLCGTLLLSPLRFAASLGAFALLVLYSAAIALNLARGRLDIDCGCSGPALRQPLSPWLLARNAALMALAAAGALPVAARALGALDAMPVAAGAAVFFVGYSAANQLAANAPGSAALRSRA